MKKYTYLFTDPSGNRPANETLESNTLLTETSLIIRDEIEKKFIHFDNPTPLFKSYIFLIRKTNYLYIQI